jgi:hypothetical protein
MVLVAELVAICATVPIAPARVVVRLSLLAAGEGDGVGVGTGDGEMILPKLAASTPRAS